MSTALLLLLSAALIVVGVWLVWRDVGKKRREAFMVQPEQPASSPDPDVEISISRPSPSSAPIDDVTKAVPLPEPAQAPEAAAQWAKLQLVLKAALEQVNAVLAGAGISIGASGEPSWSMNRGY